MKNEGGQTLIEVLAAFGVGVVLVSAIAIAVLSAISNATFSKNQTLATQYAQEGMEIVRQKLNSGSLPNESTVAYCLDKNHSDLQPKSAPGCGRNIDGIFTREIIIDNRAETNDPCSDIKLTAVVSWSDSKCTGSEDCHNVKLVSCLSDRNIVPAP